MSKLHLVILSPLLLGAIGILFLFQNCSKTDSPTTSAGSGSSFCQTNPNDASCSQSQAAGCSFNGQSIAEGQTVTAYLNSSVSSGSSCDSQVRTCTKGALSGTYNYATCTTSPAISCLFNGQTIASGASVAAYLNSTVAAGSTCQTQVRICTNGALSGNYDFASCQVAAYASCTFNGQTVPHGSSVTAYLSSQVPSGQQCQPQIRTCLNGAMTGQGNYASCSVAGATSCLFNGQTVANGQSVQAYTTSTVAFGKTCQPQSRTCSNGVLSGSGDYGNCVVGQPAACLINGLTIASGGTITLYFAATDPTCPSEVRTCTNGALSGSATLGSCQPTGAAQTAFINAYNRLQTAVAAGTSSQGLQPYVDACLDAQKVALGLGLVADNASCTAQQQAKYQAEQKYNAGKAFNDAYASLEGAVNSKLGSAALQPYVDVCVAAQNNARTWGVAVDSWSCTNQQNAIKANEGFVAAYQNLQGAKANGATGSLLNKFITACTQAQDNARSWGDAVDSWSCN